MSDITRTYVVLCHAKFQCHSYCSHLRPCSEPLLLSCMLLQLHSCFKQVIKIASPRIIISALSLTDWKVTRGNRKVACFCLHRRIYIRIYAGHLPTQTDINLALSMVSFCQWFQVLQIRFFCTVINSCDDENDCEISRFTLGRTLRKSVNWSSWVPWNSVCYH